ncbi:MAG: hypothetical protein KDB04_10605 [Acidimicrobiales bacterium]|nr:hypothetical protein [Acidimicrobiales bacterium]
MLIDSALLATALGAPLAAVAAAATAPDRADEATARTAGALGVGAVAAVALGVSTTVGSAARLGPLEVDPFAALVLVLVLGMGATVVSFAARALRDEPYQRRFAGVGAALVGAAATVAAADDLVVLGLAWVATSGLTVALVATGPAAGRVARTARLRRALVVGDVAVVAALALLALRSGATGLDQLDAGGRWGAAAGVLLVIGAAARAATAPFHRWLPDTLGAPTPSSALLHAGVVNGGAILLLALSPAIAPHAAPAVLAVVVGALSCAFAEAVMLTRPDVKGSLAWSTIAQMSFTLVLVGLGLETAAALHLVAHGLYKGALFLGSGGTVRSLGRSRSVAPGAPPRPVLSALLAVAALGAAVGTVAANGADPTADLLVPVGLAVLTGAIAGRAWLARTATARAAATGIVGTAALVALFTVVTIGLKHAIRPGLDVADPALPAATLVAVLAPLVAIAWADRRADRPALARLWARARLAGAAAPLGRPAPPSSPIPSAPAPRAAVVGG